MESTQFSQWLFTPDELHSHMLHAIKKIQPRTEYQDVEQVSSSNLWG